MNLNSKSPRTFFVKAAGDSKGVALILVLVVLAIITAMVVEFSYAVYMNTAALHNWKESQRLSYAARSGVNLASKAISEDTSGYSVAVVEVPADGILTGFDGALRVLVEDENARFNVNSVVYPNGSVNQKAFDSFTRLLNALDLDPGIAARLSDWIDPDSEPRVANSEDEAKNAPLDGIDELMDIRGMTRDDYDALKAYITVFGNGTININSADAPVLMALSDAMDAGLAQRIIEYRETSPFESQSDIMRLAGFEGLGASLMGAISVKGNAFRITSSAEATGVKRVIETVVEPSGKKQSVRFWREF